MSNCKKGLAVGFKYSNKIILLVCGSDIYDKSMTGGEAIAKYVFLHPEGNIDDFPLHDETLNKLKPDSSIYYKIPHDIIDFFKKELKNNSEDPYKKIYNYITKKQTIPTPIKKPTFIFIDNENTNVDVILEIFMLLDMYKDFVINSLNDAPDTNSGSSSNDPNIPINVSSNLYNQEQSDIIKNKLYEITNKIVNYPNISSLIDVLYTFITIKSSPDKIYKELYKLLNVNLFQPKILMINLFPNLLDDQTFYIQFLRTLKIATNDENIFKILKNISSDYINQKQILINNSDVSNRSAEKNAINSLIKLNEPQNPTIVWIDADPGSKRINTFSGMIPWLSKNYGIKSIITPATHLDDAPEKNSIITYVKNIIIYKTGNFNIEFKSKIITDPPLISLNLIKSNNDNYILKIDKFFSLNCSSFDIDYVGSIVNKNGKNKINRQSCWENLYKLFKKKEINPHPNIKLQRDGIYNISKYEKLDMRDDKQHELLDLCIKSNKTVMDTMKLFFAKLISLEYDDHDLFSIFNDKNAAILMSAIYKKGLVVYGSGIKNLDLINTNNTEEYIALRREQFNILFEPYLFDKIIDNEIIPDNTLQEVDYTYNRSSMEFGKRSKQNLKQILKNLNKDIIYLNKV
jgi:hypothetical protein